jgi:hypothetical protein
MKFLESKDISVQEDGVSIIFKPVSMLNHTALLGYQVALNEAVEANDVGRNVQAQMKTVVYALNEMIRSISIDGDSFDPVKIASCADPSDNDTFKTLKIIYNMVTGLMVQGATKKKSSTPQPRIKKA